MITRVERAQSGISRLVVFCESCRPDKGTLGKHLSVIDNGDGDAAQACTPADIEVADLLASQHELHYPTHSIVIYHYS